MILTLVPKVSADGKDGATELASQRLAIDVAVRVRQETDALVAGEFALSGTHADTVVHSIRLSEGRVVPVFKDVLASVKEVRFAFPGWLQDVFPVCYVENDDNSASASYGPVAGNLVDLHALDGHGDVVFGDGEGSGSWWCSC